MAAPAETEDQSIRCPPHWTGFGSRCFRFFWRTLAWVDAEKHCISVGGNLASVHNADENAFLRDHIETVSGARRHTWIGGSDGEREGQWLWSDGTPFDYARWSIGEPNNYGYEHCVEMNWGGNYWNDNRCYHHKHFVCVRPQSQ
ncbi:galactose-specific lectin nattectin-like [Centropristis striata]|uniref:galactose-specific lectin nattectin-like n=1 Tax=Centropristis striata TaxID=184440 RepID=UPI0027E10328|nr:galactose-specific lectin nattectin-like [Centropristis striata]